MSHISFGYICGFVSGVFSLGLLAHLQWPKNHLMGAVYALGWIAATFLAGAYGRFTP